jgi:hypothetical protein
LDRAEASEIEKVSPQRNSWDEKVCPRRKRELSPHYFLMDYPRARRILKWNETLEMTSPRVPQKSTLKSHQTHHKLGHGTGGDRTGKGPALYQHPNALSAATALRTRRRRGRRLQTKTYMSASFCSP